jgi:hypothetical protein
VDRNSLASQALSRTRIQSFGSGIEAERSEVRLYISMWDLASGEQLECPPSRGRGLEFRSSIAKFSLP